MRTNLEKRAWHSGTLWLTMALTAGLAVSCGREKHGALRAGVPGVTVENGTELLIALPIENTTDVDAHDVEVREIELRGGHLDLPARLPVDLGTIAADGRKVIQIRFAVPGLNLAKVYELEVEGRYRGRRPDDKDDRERERKFEFETKLQIPPQQPITA